MLALGVDGKFYPCIRYMSYALNNDRPPMIIGDVEKGMDSKEENEHLKCLTCITRRSQSTDECFDCSVGQGCSWCTAYHYDVFGDPNKRATYICKMHKARVLGNYYYWTKLYEKIGREPEFELHLSEADIKFIKGEE